MRLREALTNLAAVAATLVAAAAVGHRVVRSVADSTTVALGRSVENWELLAQRGPRLGPTSARLVIVEFSDFQCSYCKQAASVLREVRRRRPHDVAVVYRHFPLSERTLDAAIAAECADRAGRFEAMHDILFAQSDSIGIKPWVRFAAEAGVGDTVALRACIRARAPAEAVWRDIHAADSLQIGETPTYLVGDRMFAGAPNLERLDGYLRSLLRRW